MIEVTPTTELPTWPAFLDGNLNKYEPQQLEYLDGNIKVVPLSEETLDKTILVQNTANKEAFNFTDNGQAILSTNTVDFSIIGNTISYHSHQIDLGKSVQEIEDLIVVKAKTPGFYVWTTPNDFGSFLVHQGVFKQNINYRYINTDFIFCLNYPRNRDYTLVSQVNPNFKVHGTKDPLKELSSADRPLGYFKNEPILHYTTDMIQQFMNTYPWKTDNLDTIIIKSQDEKLECFILKDTDFYWANLSFKESYVTPGGDMSSSVYSITNLSITEVERVMTYGDKLMVIKSYNKLLIDSV